MQNILITTDFSEASRHALDYACLLMKDTPVALDLLHIFEVPITYTSDSLALTGVSHEIEMVEDRMILELDRVKTAHPGLQIEGRVITGSFLDTVLQEVLLTKPAFMILGTAGFNDFYLGDQDPLNALRMVTVPVLFIPLNAPIKPIKKLAYACNYANVGVHTPVQQIISFVQFTNASLQIIHADKQAQGYDVKQVAGQQWLDGQLRRIAPAFHWIEDADVLHGLSSLIASNDIDCLVVVPRKYGIWESLFHSSRTKALARLNKVPIIAFHEK